MSSASVILLNYDYTFLNKVPIKKAMLYIAKDKVTIEKASDSEVIRSFSDEQNTPLVIRLVYLIKAIYKRHVVWTKRNVMIRDDFTCKYCGDDNKSRMTVDHVHPKAKGGGNTFENTVCACKMCNSNKGDKLLSELNMFYLDKKFTPYQPTIFQFIKKYHENIGIDGLLREYGVY